MTQYFYSVNAGLAPLNPQAVTVQAGGGAPTADVYVQVNNANQGVVNKMQLLLCLQQIMLLIQGEGVGTASTGTANVIPPINP
jgi:hypothetical protein